MIAFPNSEKEEGVLYVHFDTSENVYLVKEEKLGACVWQTETKALTFIKEVLQDEIKEGEEIGFLIVSVDAFSVKKKD